MKGKIDLVKVAKIGGVVLSVVGSLFSAYASDKQTKAIIEKLVDEKLASK